MIRKCAMVLAVLALGFVVAAPAQAGGGGGKKTATIRVRNRAGVTVYSLANPGVAAPTSFSGGQAIANGGVAAFKVAPGSGLIWAATDAAGTLNVGNGAYVGTGSQTGYVNVDPPAGGFPSILPLVVAGSATAF